ncbi:hypothetical protein scyTo_0013800 [Scyliorhinus torazame]|uniref:Reverse transcriptase domain-containing protein n=1 Tax=Scyliorhinus torazame TaxID=75743 RepID=A0A401P524_SCYTO|nr:hypothetical protein [Scyliorhinus torazame]
MSSVPISEEKEDKEEDSVHLEDSEMDEEEEATSIRAAGKKGHLARADSVQGAILRFLKSRTVPYAMKREVEEELERLQRLGLIEPIQISRWSAPIVPVLKNDGMEHTIIGYKLTINQVFKLEAYSLPRVEDAFSNLAGGMFSKLDMSQTYKKVLRKEDLKQYMTIDTWLVQV